MWNFKCARQMGGKKYWVVFQRGMLKPVMINFEQALDYINEREIELQAHFKRISAIAVNNQAKMLDAFQAERIGTHHFQTTTGYGYHDIGREALENVFARVFRAESALVR